MNSTVKTLLLWVVLIITGVLLWQVVSRTQSGTEKDKDCSYILNEIEKGSVENVEITGSEVKGKFKDGSAFNAGPAISGNRMYIRSDRFLYCLQDGGR